MSCSPFAQVEFLESVKPLLGLPVSHTWQGYGSAIFLELGELSPASEGRHSYSRGQACIWVQWDWRVERGVSVLFGSSEGRPSIQRGLASLEGTCVQSIAVSGEVPELQVEFSNGLRLRSMVMAAGDPQWTIRLQGGDYIVVKSGVLASRDDRPELDAEELAIFALADRTGLRWGVPREGVSQGACSDCGWFIQLDGQGSLLDYGACSSPRSPFDGRVVNRASGCSAHSGVATSQSDTTSSV